MTLAIGMLIMWLVALPALTVVLALLRSRLVARRARRPSPAIAPTTSTHALVRDFPPVRSAGGSCAPTRSASRALLK